jgi:hypothetical protein
MHASHQFSFDSTFVDPSSMEMNWNNTVIDDSPSRSSNGSDTSPIVSPVHDIDGLQFCRGALQPFTLESNVAFQDHQPHNTNQLLTSCDASIHSMTLQDSLCANLILQANDVINQLTAVAGLLGAQIQAKQRPAAAFQTVSKLTTSPKKNKSTSFLGLRIISDDFCHTWYAERPFPAFTVDVYDTVSSCSWTKISAGWMVKVSLLDGYGEEINNKFSNSMQTPICYFPIINGSATISDLRFLSVSSKHGGCFQLRLSLQTPFSSELLPTTTTQEHNAFLTETFENVECLSEQFQILSYRLYHVPKLEAERLTPEDALHKLKGIGNLYAQRFAEIGIQTVRDLAGLDLLRLSESSTKSLLNHLRKDRGAMTQTKLVEYVSMARDIVVNFESNNNEQPNCFVGQLKRRPDQHEQLSNKRHCS